MIVLFSSSSEIEYASRGSGPDSWRGCAMGFGAVHGCRGQALGVSGRFGLTHFV